MSESPAPTKVSFTEKEEMVILAATTCWKGGIPEVDLEKLTVAAGFNTKKTCSNTWGNIKKKLAGHYPPVTGDSNGDEDALTPFKKTTGKRKKAVKAETESEGDAEPATPVKSKKRKSSAKKTKSGGKKVKVEDPVSDDDEETEVEEGEAVEEGEVVEEGEDVADDNAEPSAEE